MTRHRISRIVTSLGLALSLSLSLVAVPGISLAALPDVQVGKGGVAQTNAPDGAIPTKVDPSEPVLIQVWAYNNDPSNISQFYLSVSTGGTLTSATWTKSGGGGSGTCFPTSTSTCSFGQLKSKTSVVISALFTAPSTFGSMANDFTFSTTGLGSGGGDNSHGDTWPVSNPVTVDDSPDFAGRYVTNNDLKIVQTGDIPSSLNKQTTIVYSPETGIGVTADDSVGCPSSSACFGQISEIFVASGKSYTAGFKVVVNLHSSEIPPGVNANTIEVFHDGVQIVDKCGTTPSPDCYSAKKFSWGIQVTIWLLHNGKLTMG
jgi:hypothetical protein